MIETSSRILVCFGRLNRAVPDLALAFALITSDIKIADKFVFSEELKGHAIRRAVKSFILEPPNGL